MSSSSNFASHKTLKILAPCDTTKAGGTTRLSVPSIYGHQEVIYKPAVIDATNQLTSLWESDQGLTAGQVVGKLLDLQKAAHSKRWGDVTVQIVSNEQEAEASDRGHTWVKAPTRSHFSEVTAALRSPFTRPSTIGVYVDKTGSNSVGQTPRWFEAHKASHCPISTGVAQAVTSLNTGASRDVQAFLKQCKEAKQSGDYTYGELTAADVEEFTQHPELGVVEVVVRPDRPDSFWPRSESEQGFTSWVGFGRN